MGFKRRHPARRGNRPIKEKIKIKCRFVQTPRAAFERIERKAKNYRPHKPMTKIISRKILLFFVLATLSGAAQAADAERLVGFSVPSRAIVAAIARNKFQRTAIELFVRTELYFGTVKPDGTEIRDEEFKRFLDDVITPLFPDGLTILTADGQFRDRRGIVWREKSKVLVLLYPARARKSNHKKIEQIRAAYKKAFRQQSVLRVDERMPVSVSF
jgi:hypothetical protein